MVACGSGTTESALSPARFVAFGDGFSDLGEGGARYTINDGSANIWSQYMANLFGQNLTTSAPVACHMPGATRVYRSSPTRPAAMPRRP